MRSQEEAFLNYKRNQEPRGELRKQDDVTFEDGYLKLEPKDYDFIHDHADSIQNQLLSSTSQYHAFDKAYVLLPTVDLVALQQKLNNETLMSTTSTIHQPKLKYEALTEPKYIPANDDSIQDQQSSSSKEYHALDQAYVLLSSVDLVALQKKLNQDTIMSTTSTKLISEPLEESKYNPGAEDSIITKFEWIEPLDSAQSVQENQSDSDSDVYIVDDEITVKDEIEELNRRNHNEPMDTSSSDETLIAVKQKQECNGDSSKYELDTLDEEYLNLELDTHYDKNDILDLQDRTFVRPYVLHSSIDIDAVQQNRNISESNYIFGTDDSVVTTDDWIEFTDSVISEQNEQHQSDSDSDVYIVDDEKIVNEEIVELYDWDRSYHEFIKKYSSDGLMSMDSQNQTLVNVRQKQVSNEDSNKQKSNTVDEEYLTLIPDIQNDRNHVQDLQANTFDQSSVLLSYTDIDACQQKLNKGQMGNKKHKCISCRCALTKTTKTYLRKNSKNSYKCKLCSSAFSRLLDLKTHEKTHFLDIPHICQLCSPECTERCTLKYMNENGREKYKCEFCDFKTNYPTKMRYHSMKHVGDAPYVCKLCNFATNSKSKLESHENIHRYDKPYSCYECNRAFRFKSVLKSHHKIHIRAREKLLLKKIVV